MKTDETQGAYEVEDSTENAVEMLGKGYDSIRVKDESNDKKYFIITPRIVKAYSRTSHDFALWDTIKDIAGESGECYLNTEQLAILSGISTGQVSNSRKYWIKIGFLKGEIKKDPGYSQAVWHLSIPDLWAKNIEWCEKHLKIVERLEFRKAHRSLHTVKASYSEAKPSYSETKKNYQEEQLASLSIENKIFADLPVTEKDLALAKLRDTAPKMFERALGFSKPLPWWGGKDWTAFAEWVCERYAESKMTFGEYNIWRNTKYTKGGMSNLRLRSFPNEFYDSWDMFMMSQDPEEKNEYVRPEYQLHKPDNKEQYVPNPKRPILQKQTE